MATFRDLTKFLNDIADDLVKDASPLAARTVVDLIKGETRSGKQLPSKGSGRAKRQPALERSTKKYRNYIKRTPTKKHPAFSPNRSNLTISGQLIDALDFKVTRTGFEVFVKDSNRTAYSTLGLINRAKNSTPPNNQKLAEFLADAGRSFVGIDNKGLKQVSNIFEDEIRRQIRKRGLV